MPTYDYVCRACGHELEIFQSMTEGPKRKCPACGQSKLQRRIGTGAGIVFKGSGFYQTDYRSKAYHEARKKEEGGGSQASDGASQKPEKPGKPGKPDQAGKQADREGRSKPGPDAD